MPLVDPDINSSVEKLQECMSQLMGAYDEEWLGAMAAKFGIFEPGNEDAKIVQAFLSYLEGEKLDFTIEFRRLIGDDGINSRDDSQVSDDFRRMWHQRLEKQAHSLEQARERMRQSNPVYIPRNHQVERAIQSGVVGDYSVFERMNECLKAPFERREEFAEFERPPEPGEVVRATFCGT